MKKFKIIIIALFTSNIVTAQQTKEDIAQWWDLDLGTMIEILNHTSSQTVSKWKRTGDTYYILDNDIVMLYNGDEHHAWRTQGTNYNNIPLNCSSHYDFGMPADTKKIFFVEFKKFQMKYPQISFKLTNDTESEFVFTLTRKQ